jgi:hypothetical protein
MRTTCRVLAVAGTVLGSLVLAASVAQAAPPPNDDVENATLVTTPLPYTDAVDTSEATTTPEEAAYNEFCGAPAMERAVWYRSTATGDADFAVFDVTASDYSAGILVLAGSGPGDLSPIACAQGVVSGPVSSGTQLWFMVFEDGTAPLNGDTLRVEVRLGTAPPQVELTLDPRASVDRDGVAYLSGTVRCSDPSGDGTLFGIDGYAHQKVGRASVRAYFFVPLDAPCDGTLTPWTAEAVPEFGDRFAGGKATTVAFAFACGIDQCSDAFVETTVTMLRNLRR